MPLIFSPSGNAVVALWLTTSAPAAFSFDEDAVKPIGSIRRDNGTVFASSRFRRSSPAKKRKLPPDLMMKIVGDHAPARGVPVSHPLMHRTRTVDYAIIMSGEIDMMLDDKTVHLKAGDVVVQQATNHAWLNHGTDLPHHLRADGFRKRRTRRFRHCEQAEDPSICSAAAGLLRRGRLSSGRPASTSRT